MMSIWDVVLFHIFPNTFSGPGMEGAKPQETGVFFTLHVIPRTFPGMWIDRWPYIIKWLGYVGTGESIREL